MGLGLLAVWYVGSRQVLEGRLTLGELVTVTGYLWILYWPWQWFGWTSSLLTQALAGAERVFEILDAPTEPYGDRSARPLGRVEGRVAFRSVSFGYEPGRPVLEAVDLDVAAGETLGVVGSSGAGKTTLVNLLCRFYDPDEGWVEVDGVDLRELRLEDWRGRLGLVAQEPFLFSGTVAENIAYGRPGARFEDLVAAARVANVHAAVVSKPDGYDTDVGQRGQHLSGGERQRVALARAILRNPAVLILDEATSSVDPVNERLIRDAVARLARARTTTTFVIAHRLSTVRHADRIVVLDAGRIAEVGTWEQLVARRGAFWTLLHAQYAAADSPQHGEGVANFVTAGPGLIRPNRWARPASDTGSVTTQAVRLSRSPAGRVSLGLSGRRYENVQVRRALPLSDADHHVVFLNERSEEIYTLGNPEELSAHDRRIVDEELAHYYVVAVARRLHSVRDEGGTHRLDLETNRGRREFIVADDNIRRLGNGGLILVDLDGNRLEVPIHLVTRRWLGLLEPEVHE